MRATFFLILFAAQAQAGMSAWGDDYEGAPSVLMDGEEIPAAAQFVGWWTGSGGTYGLGDGAFWWMVSGWSAYGYQQSITPWDAPTSPEGWGWLVLQEGDGPELGPIEISLGCLSGGVGSVRSESPFQPGLTVWAQVGEEAQTLSLDRLRFDGDLLEVDCADTGWPHGAEISITISWFGGVR